MSNKLNTWLLAGIFLLQIVIVALLVRQRSAGKPIVIDDAFMKSFVESFAASLNKVQSVSVDIPPPQNPGKDGSSLTIEIQADRVSMDGKTMSVSEFEKQAPNIVGPTTKVLLQDSGSTNYKTSIEVLEILRKNGVVQISSETAYRQSPK
ncbi:MAG: biopolymer transporter ExbD [Nibricoccus sp.]